MHNNKIIAFEFFCVIQNKQDLGECYQPSASTKITPTSILFIPNITEKHRQAIWQSWIVNYLRPSRAARPFKLPCSLAPESGRFKENSFQPFIYWQTNLFCGCWGCTFKLPYCPVFKLFLCELNDDQPNREKLKQQNVGQTSIWNDLCSLTNDWKLGQCSQKAAIRC